MTRLPFNRFAVLAVMVIAAAFRPGGAVRASEDAVTLVASPRLADITGIIQKEIAGGRIPGAVVETGQADTVLYRGALGWRATWPDSVPMTPDTVFDLASLTKVVVTTTAVLQLAERGRLDLDQPVAAYWPRFAANGKGSITSRDLLTHYSGLRADLDVRHPWSGYQTAMQMLVDEKPLARRGTRYLYSDENFEVLGEVVRRISGVPLDVYSDRTIFKPLRMTHTRFGPQISRTDALIAPTTLGEPVPHAVRVNDPTAARMGGVSGHAGLFSTADDLARFARMLLKGGELDGVRVLQPASIALAVSAQSPVSGQRLRGLGWDLAQATSGAGPVLPSESYGHTGYTGTLIWIDPASAKWAIILTNRTYPDGHGDAQPLRDEILGRVFGAENSEPAADHQR